jgi:ABC-type multidrug transport system ATPase subunit
VPAADADRVVQLAVNKLGIGNALDRHAGTLSGGTRRKLSLALAILGSPSIVWVSTCTQCAHACADARACVA